MKFFIVFFLLFISSNTHAEIKTSAQQAWEKTKEVTHDVIAVSKDAGGKVIDASKQAYTSFSELSSRQLTPEERFAEIWADAIEQMDNGLATLKKMKKAPESAFFREDKKSIREDFNEILDEMIVLLDDPYIQRDRKQIASLQNQIEKKKNLIVNYHERKVVAPQEHTVKTTKDDYVNKIKEEKKDIIELQDQIDSIYVQLQERLRAVGLNLNLNQTIALLSRVDSEDIIQMSMVFDELKRIVEQLKVLTQNSSEEIKTAKRYYGMHLVLIEMIVYMQGEYIERIDNQFIPRLTEIINGAVSLASVTRKNISREADPWKKGIYENNLQAQELTITVGNLYIHRLMDQKAKVETARNKALDDLKLANNTFDTVEMSAELLSMLDQSQQSFNTIMALQLPDIVPFENLEMEMEFKKLSKIMEKD